VCVVRALGAKVRAERTGKLFPVSTAYQVFWIGGELTKLGRHFTVPKVFIPLLRACARVIPAARHG